MGVDIAFTLISGKKGTSFSFLVITLYLVDIDPVLALYFFGVLFFILILGFGD